MLRRVAIVAGDFVKTGGMDRANYALADYLTRSSVPVELVSHRIDPVLAERPTLRWHRVPRPAGWHAAGEPLLDARARLVARGMRLSGELCIANGGNSLAGGINWVHYVHAEYPQRLDRSVAGLKRWALSGWSARRERQAFARARMIVTNSEATRRALIDRIGVDAARVRTIYYGIDAARFGPVGPEERERARRELGLRGRMALAFVGALGDRRKGFDVLFAAFQMLAKESGWDVDLVVVGAGATVPLWRERAERSGLADRIHFLGFRRDVPFVLAGCDGMVAPTRYEAFGLGVAEALARGLPALVSRRAGVAELYPPELRELLIDDVESVAEVASRLRAFRAGHDQLTASIAPLAERVRERSWDQMAREIVDLIADQAPGQLPRSARG
jgi:glycosyltransferase involved in cell wall biosynthesis